MKILTARIFVVVKFSVVITTLALMMVGTPVKAYADHPEKNLKKKENREENAGDTIELPVPMHQKLNDPNYDTRYDRGSIQPWHDLKSIYLRRTIPLSQLALLPQRQYALLLKEI